MPNKPAFVARVRQNVTALIEITNRLQDDATEYARLNYAQTLAVAAPAQNVESGFSGQHADITAEQFHAAILAIQSILEGISADEKAIIYQIKL